MTNGAHERIALLLGLAVLLILPPAVKTLGQPFLVTVATRILIYGIAAASLDLLLGFGGMVSFGHAAFLGLGGYTVGILAAQYNAGEAFLGFLPGTDQLLVALPVAIVVAGLAAFAFGAIALRTRGVQFIMITLALAQMVFFIFVSVKAFGGDDGLILTRRDALPGFDLRDNTGFYYLSLVFLIAFLALCRRIIGSRFGIVLQGIRENERRMAALGHAPYGYKLAAFTIAGAGGGLAGALLANLDKFVSPDLLHWTKSGDLLIMVVIGGAGTLYGAVLGAAALIGFETLLSPFTDHWMIVLGPLLVLIALTAERGLYGSLVKRGRVR